MSDTVFFQLFKDATQFFSRATPNLAKMDHIDQHLATAARNDTYRPCIQAAVAMGKKLLNKYYSYTDHSELYRIAMGMFRCILLRVFTLIYFNSLVLHPSHKLSYFSQAGWKEEWRVAAEDIVQTEFERSYAGIDIRDSNDTGRPTVSNSIILQSVI